jgi:hypothetical protein
MLGQDTWRLEILEHLAIVKEITNEEETILSKEKR